MNALRNLNLSSALLGATLATGCSPQEPAELVRIDVAGIVGADADKDLALAVERISEEGGSTIEFSELEGGDLAVAERSVVDAIRRELVIVGLSVIPTDGKFAILAPLSKKNLVLDGKLAVSTEDKAHPRVRVSCDAFIGTDESANSLNNSGESIVIGDTFALGRITETVVDSNGELEASGLMDHVALYSLVGTKGDSIVLECELGGSAETPVETDDLS